MPISARKLIYDYTRKLNALNSTSNQEYKIVDAVSAINEAWEVIYENNVRLAEKDSYRRNLLRQLEVKNKSLTFTQEGNKYFVEYPADFYHRLNHIVVAQGCEECGDYTKEIVPKVVQSDDLHRTRKDPYWKADFKWEQLPLDEAQNGFWLYTDDEMKIKEVSIDYYKKLTYIQAPSLVECNDQSYLDWDVKRITKDVDFQVDSTYIARKVVDVAVFLTQTAQKDTEGTQLILQKMAQFEVAS